MIQVKNKDGKMCHIENRHIGVDKAIRKRKCKLCTKDILPGKVCVTCYFIGIGYGQPNSEHRSVCKDCAGRVLKAAVKESEEMVKYHSRRSGYFATLRENLTTALAVEKEDEQAARKHLVASLKKCEDGKYRPS